MTALIIATTGVALILLIFRATRGRLPWAPFPESVQALDRIAAEEKHGAPITLADHTDHEETRP